MMITPQSDESAIAPRLGLWDAVSIIVGIVVGTSIFRSTAMVFDNAGGPWTTMALWLLGGVLAWCGAVCYAELATTYPRDGGDYEYLNRAFGPWCGFLFSWAQITTVISGNIAIMAYAFADYLVRLQPAWNEHLLWLTLGPVVALSALNMAGVVAGKFTQNVLTAAKVIGLTGLVLAGVITSSMSTPQPRAEAAVNNSATANLGLALVFVLYAYGGWSHAAYVAAEVRDERRNLPRALMLGIAGITLIYLAVNGAYLAALGFEGARVTQTPAADVLEQACGPWGGQAISLLVMLSALGAINGMILTGSRIYAVWGADYPALAWLGAWNRRAVAPVAAIALQAAIAMLLVLLVGTAAGRNAFDAALHLIGVAGLPWEQYHGGFETLVAGSAPVFWGLCLLTGIAVFVLRAIDPTTERPFTMPLYPLPALVFCGTCAYILQASVLYARWLTLLGAVPLAAGGMVWFAVRSKRPPTTP
jgi:basic amino acid/polyamine antiporter, APA family